MHVIAAQIETPLKDAYQARLDAINEKDMFTDDKLSKGDYAAFNNKTNNVYTGFVSKVGKNFITIECPYGGWGGNDYLQIMELKFDRSALLGYYKPMQTT